MTVETANYISQLDPDLPTNADLESEGAAQIRTVKTAVQQSFPNISGPVTATNTDLSKVGVTQAATSNDTSVASTAFVGTAILNAALSTELPAQSGNAGKALETSGTVANWGFQRKIVRRAITANDTALTTDRGNLLDLSGTFTLAFSAAATLTDGWYVCLSNTGTTAVTLNPDGAELIDGAATKKLYPNQSCIVVCNGTSLYTIGRKESTVLLQTQTASASASLNFTDFVDSEFDDYFVLIDKLLPATDGAILRMRTSTNAGSSYDSGGSDYHASRIGTSAAGAAAPANATSSGIDMSSSIGNAANEVGISGRIDFCRPSDASYFGMTFAVGWIDTGTIPLNMTGSGYRLAAADVDAFQLLFSSGNITSGSAKLYGVRK